MVNLITKAAIVLIGIATIAASTDGSAGEATRLFGDAKALGEGTIRTYIDTDRQGRPTAIGIQLEEAALHGLPPLKNATSRCFDLNDNGKIDGPGECEGDQEVELQMPEAIGGREDIPFRWVGLNWNAEGHPPAPWSVPHFDMHFYIADYNEIALIRVGACQFFINCEDRKVALEPVPAKYVAPDHINVEATVSRMGNHLIDARTPELAQPPARGFTHTWIFGTNRGRITFYEPMITLAFLLSRPDVCTPIRQPQAFQQAGYYPTEYCIRFDNETRVYTISMEGMVKRAAE